MGLRMAQREVERDFQRKVREHIAVMREMELVTLLRIGSDYGLEPERAREVIDWIRRGEAKALNTPKTERTVRAVDWDAFEVQAKRDEESPWALKPYFPM